MKKTQNAAGMWIAIESGQLPTSAVTVLTIDSHGNVAAGFYTPAHERGSGLDVVKYAACWRESGSKLLIQSPAYWAEIVKP